MDAGKMMRDIAAADSVMPDIRELLAHINAAYGGTEECAKMIVADVLAAPEGSSQRLSFHNNYLGAVAKFGGNDDLETMDPEALAAEAKRLHTELGGNNADA